MKSFTSLLQTSVIDMTDLNTNALLPLMNFQSASRHCILLNQSKLPILIRE